MTSDQHGHNEGNLPIGNSSVRNYDRISYILVVDDDNTLLKFFKIHLNKFFSKVIVVKNAKEAVATFKEKEIDLVLCDIRMPRIDGFQLMRKVRRHDPRIPVLLISWAMLSSDQETDAEGEADGFLRKPFSIDELHAFINRGMELRASFVRLAELLGDRKLLRQVLRGKRKVERLVANDKGEEAKSILAFVKKAG